ncbi:MAG: hypothetical protein E7344_03830 [Clostridiales bacterium]|nr:hypothetical protein [Clostridiales bacterium]
MKINLIKIKGLFDEAFDVYIKTDVVPESCDNIFCDACDLAKAIDFLFLNKSEGLCDGTAECEFEYAGCKYNLSRTKSFDNVASILREQDGESKKRYTQVDEKLRQLFKTDVKKLFDGMVIESDEFNEFNQNPSLSFHKDVADLFEVQKQTQVAYNEALDRKNQLKLQIKAITSKPIKAIKASQLDELREQTNDLQKEYIDTLAQIALLKDSLRTLSTKENLQKDIDSTKDHINRLKENSEFIDEKRKQLEDHNRIQAFLPQLKDILSYKKQLAETKQLAEKDSEELEWLRSERQGVVSQLEELSHEIDRKVEQNTRLMLIRHDSDSIESLCDRNEELGDRILQLQSEKEALELTRDSHKSAIESIDNAIEQAKDQLKSIDVPVHSINELIENVRTNVRIKEVEKQLDSIEKEVVFVASQLSDRELDVKKQQDTVNTLLKIDGIVTPFKSKDTLLQILQSKINKSEVILQSLSEKQHNLREEIQNLHYKEIELDQSADCLQTLLSQKQYDRDLVIRKQAISEQQALPATRNGMNVMVAPTTCAFIDEHIESLKSDLVRRNNKKLEIASRQAGLKCVLTEVDRQKQIVLGDIVACRNERDAIIRRFRELVKAGNNEVISSYFKALELGKSTGYLLDIQRGLVETQTQIALIKEKYNDLIREKKEVTARLGRLCDLQQAIDLKQMTVEMMVDTNEEIKASLVDLTDKLVLLQTQRKSESDGLEATEQRLSNLVSVLNDVVNEKKSNEKEMLKIRQKISMFAKGNPDEAQQNVQVRVNALMSEKRLLEENKNDLDEKILVKSIEIEKHELVLSTLMASYHDKKAKAQSIMSDLGEDDIEAIKLKNLSDESYKNIKDAVDRFDVTLESLYSRLEHLQSLFDQNKDEQKQRETWEQVELLEQKCLATKERLDQSKTQLADLTEEYIQSDKTRYDLANLLHQYNSNKSLDVVLRQNQVVKLVVEQEIGKILTSASRIYSTLCGSGEIVCVDEKFALKIDDVITPFADLSVSDKLCIFLSIKLCDMQIKFPQCRTVLLHGSLPLNVSEMAGRLANLSNYVFVVDALSTDIN